MNTDTPKKSKFDILEEIMINFQNDYETDNAQTHWVKTYKERRERLIQLQEEEYELQANVIDDAHDLGFVEGVRYALNIMDMTNAGKNKELLERLLNILKIQRRKIMRVTVEINDEMAKAIKLYMTKAETEESLEQLIQQGAEKAASKAFVKYVPKPIRDYYKLLDQLREERS